MSSELPADRLSQISTAWSLFRQAHDHSAESEAARRALVERYYGAVYRYLLGVVHDEEIASELFQEFSLRMMQGEYFRADPMRGRLRDYLKASLRNLVRDQYAARRKWPGPLPESMPDGGAHEPSETDTEMTFEEGLRQELLQRAWSALEQSNGTYYSVLLAHVEAPDAAATELAATLSTRLGRPFTAGQIRVTLHRARQKLASLLVEEVHYTLADGNDAELQEELDALGLSEICRGVRNSPD